MKKIPFIIIIILLITQNTNGQKVTVLPLVPSVPLKIQYDCKLLSQGYPEDVNMFRARYPNKAWAPSADTTATSIFMEFGDGTFGFNSIGDHQYEKGNITYPLLTKSSGLYDDDKRPPRHTLNKMENTGLNVIDFTAPNNTSARFTPVFNSTHARGTMDPKVLSERVNIRITPSIHSVVAGDTMVYVLTYRLSGPANVKGGAAPYIRFNYNNIAAFEPVIAPGNPLRFEDLSVPQVRMYYGETAEKVNSSKSGFGNELKFTNLSMDSKEHHIFITLVPNSTLGSNGENLRGAIKVEADIMTGNNVGESAAVNMDGGMLSHDPNYISITPSCNLLPKTGKILTFKIHCQNEGLGYAKRVVMKIHLPPGISPEDIRQYNHYDSKAPYKRKGTWDFSGASLLEIEFNLAVDDNPLHALKGVYNNQAWQHDEATMADAWFSIPAHEGMPNVMNAVADIYFYNHDDTKNPAVTTNTATVKFANCCGRDCNTTKKKKKFWRWLFFTRCI